MTLYFEYFPFASTDRPDRSVCKLSVPFWRDGAAIIRKLNTNAVFELSRRTFFQVVRECERVEGLRLLWRFRWISFMSKHSEIYRVKRKLWHLERRSVFIVLQNVSITYWKKKKENFLLRLRSKHLKQFCLHGSIMVFVFCRPVRFSVSYLSRYWLLNVLKSL